MPNAPIYAVPAYADLARRLPLGDRRLAADRPWSVAFVRAIAWADGVRPSGWRRLVAPPASFLASSAPCRSSFPELLGNGQDVAQLAVPPSLAPLALALLLLLRPLATIASFASGAPGGLFTPSLTAGALMGAALGALWLWVHPGGDIGAFRAPRRRRDAGGDDPGTDLVAGR